MEISASTRIHIVTGRLAEQALRSTLEPLSKSLNFVYTIQVMPITVAALMTPAWIAPRLQIPEGTTHLLLPGYCAGDMMPLLAITDLPIEVGPKDLRRLPEFLGGQVLDETYGQWDIEIIAEINHAPRLDQATVLELAKFLKDEGATWIDVGCEPGSCWSGVKDCVSMLVQEGFRVSIDSLNPDEIGNAIAGGAELVLSVNSNNREHAVDWGCEVVVIPDELHNLDSLQPTIEWLAARKIPLRIDPILEPIGFDFAASLRRYYEARLRWPEAEMMMGIGNLTELTEVDSAGVNLMLLAICQELGIRSVLTTQVANWARSCVKECDIARRLVHYAVRHRALPKHVDSGLVMLRDSKLFEFGDETLRRLAEQIKDGNYRIFSEQAALHVLGRGKKYSDVDPFEIFDRLVGDDPENIDPFHAFYLGFELCKAQLALQLGKQYTQDEALDWGTLTRKEVIRHRLSKRNRSRNRNRPDP